MPDLLTHYAVVLQSSRYNSEVPIRTEVCRTRTEAGERAASYIHNPSETDTTPLAEIVDYMNTYNSAHVYRENPEGIGYVRIVYCDCFNPENCMNGGYFDDMPRDLELVVTWLQQPVYRDIWASRSSPEVQTDLLAEWEMREMDRMTNGTYEPLPAGLAYEVGANPAHYIHITTQENPLGDMVAYTQSTEHGIRDRQTKIKFGRYLRKYHSNLSDSQIEHYVSKLKTYKSVCGNIGARVTFVTDRATITEVFETRMYARDSSSVSCMFGKFSDWDDAPYHVYADSPDVAIACLKLDGKLVARTVVSTKNKKWIRCYSVEMERSFCDILQDKLEKSGYVHGELYGSKLTKLPKQDDMHVLPYIDGGAGVKTVRHEGKDYWEVTSGKYEFYADHTDGLVEAPCDDCENAPCTCNNCECCNRDTDDCECHYCSCCEETTRHGCDNCTMCEHCDQCRSHDNCSCDYCHECDRLEDDCNCERCAHCNSLTDDCECDICEECDELTEYCTCVNCSTCEHKESECTCTEVKQNG
jgi:hypothetical protein